MAADDNPEERLVDLVRALDRNLVAAVQAVDKRLKLLVARRPASRRVECGYLIQGTSAPWASTSGLPALECRSSRRATSSVTATTIPSSIHLEISCSNSRPSA